MSLHTTPEQHAANPPETWRIIRNEYSGRVWWKLLTDVTDAEDVHGTETFKTKREATAALTSGFVFNLYAKEGRWFAGEKVDNWKSYAETLAERARLDARRAAAVLAEVRKVERMGTTPENLARWATESKSEHLGTLQNAAEEMHTLLNAGDLLNPELLKEAEARELYRELAETWGFTSPVGDRIHRIKYLGLDGEMSTLEVLEEMASEEAEALRVRAVAA